MKLYRLLIDILMFLIPIIVCFYANLIGVSLIMFIYGFIHFKYPWLVTLIKKLYFIKDKTNVVIW